MKEKIDRQAYLGIYEIFKASLTLGEGTWARDIMEYVLSLKC